MHSVSALRRELSFKVAGTSEQHRGHTILLVGTLNVGECACGDEKQYGLTQPIAGVPAMLPPGSIKLRSREYYGSQGVSIIVNMGYQSPLISEKTESARRPRDHVRVFRASDQVRLINVVDAHEP